MAASGWDFGGDQTIPLGAGALPRASEDDLWTHQLSDLLELRPEIGYYHSSDVKAFDLGKRNYLWMGGLDIILRF